MKQIFGRVVLALLVGAAVVYAVDFAVWRVRVARGGGMGTVAVTYFTVASLKGGREEFYPDGEGPATCSQSVLPEGGAKPCWWVAKHPVVFER